MDDVTVQGLHNMERDATSHYRLEAINPANWLIYLGGKQPTNHSQDQPCGGGSRTAPITNW